MGDCPIGMQNENRGKNGIFQNISEITRHKFYLFIYVRWSLEQDFFVCVYICVYESLNVIEDQISSIIIEQKPVFNEHSCRIKKS